MRKRNETTFENLQIAIPQPNRLWESVLASLRMAIITGELSAGTHLLETQLAEKLAVSRGPLREALVHLEQEGLVTDFPHRGKFVAELSNDDIHEIYELRLLTESYAVERALGSVPPDVVRQLQALTDTMVDLAAHHRFEEMADVDLQFHRQIVSMAGMKRLVRLWESLSNVSHALIVTVASSSPDITHIIGAGHQECIAAVTAGDQDAFKEALRVHLVRAKQQILRLRPS